jgi:hypothetical protein
MRPGLRWLVAIVVTVAAFALATWISGAFVLPLFMKDGGARWVVATALGVAVAALAALWGHWFATEAGTATAGPDGQPSAAPHGSTKRSGRTSNKITGGDFRGPVIQGRDISGPATGGQIPPPGRNSGTRDSGTRDSGTRD